MDEIKYNEWIEVEVKGIPFFKYELENGDKIIYSMNEFDILDIFCIYINGATKYHTQDELGVLNMLYISSGENLETLRSIMNLTYKEMLTGDYSYLGRMID